MPDGEDSRYIVQWSESEWRALYPQFGEGQPYYCSSDQLSALWNVATTLVANTAESLVPYDSVKGIAVRKVLLYALMCHLATLAWQGRQGQYGMLTNASEGSVSAGFQMPQLPAGGVTQAWYSLTPCGLTAWTLLRRFSLGGYIVTPHHYHPWG